MKIKKRKNQTAQEGQDDTQVLDIEEKVAKQEIEDGGKHVKKLTIVSTIWSLISTAYAIVSTSMFLKNGWIEHELSYVLIVMLAVFGCIFVGLVALSFKKPEKVKVPVKTYKTLLKIFKSFSNVAFLALSAISMAGIAGGGMSLVKWIMFGATFFVAIVQLSLKIALLVLKTVRRSVAKHYKVKVNTYVNGRKQKQSLLDKLDEKSYKED